MGEDHFLQEDAEEKRKRLHEMEISGKWSRLMRKYNDLKDKEEKLRKQLEEEERKEEELRLKK